MERLDPSYLTQLVTRTIAGSSNSFCELFGATRERLFAYALWMTSDKEEAKEILKESYIFALGQMHSNQEGLVSVHTNGLHHPGLFLPWMARIIKRSYSKQITNEPYNASLQNLPLTEAVVLTMKVEQALSEKMIGDTLNLSRSAVKRNIKNGLRHLRKEAGASIHSNLSKKKEQKWPTDTLSEPEAAAMLDDIYEACGLSPNTVPMEALHAYAVYRKERFSLQRGVLIGALVLFLLLPLLFIAPGLQVECEQEGERGLPVYTVDVSSPLPVRKVTAVLKNHSLPVYEATAKRFTVEPTRNGVLTITVELDNRQEVTREVEVEDVDMQCPQLISSNIQEETVLLVVKDEGIGVDFQEIVIRGSSGAAYEPLEIREASGEIILAFPTESLDVYIPDHIGNMLHLALTLESMKG